MHFRRRPAGDSGDANQKQKNVGLYMFNAVSPRNLMFSDLRAALYSTYKSWHIIPCMLWLGHAIYVPICALKRLRNYARYFFC